MDMLRLAVYVACTILPILFVVYLIGGILRRRSSQVMLCMECEQCMAVCPLTRKNGHVVVGPKDIMIAAKTGNIRWAIEHGALLCPSCKACEKRCPRGLAPYVEVEKWRTMTIEQTIESEHPHEPSHR